MNMVFKREMPTANVIQEMYPLTEEMRERKRRNDEEVQAAVLHARRPRVVRVGAVRRVHRRAEAPLREVKRRAVELVAPHEAPSVLRRARRGACRRQQRQQRSNPFHPHSVPFSRHFSMPESIAFHPPRHKPTHKQPNTLPVSVLAPQAPAHTPGLSRLSHPSADGNTEGTEFSRRQGDCYGDCASRNATTSS